MKPFHRLTLRGQARRIRPLALSALQSYGLDVERLRLLSNDTNTSFRVDTREGSTYALRVNYAGPSEHTLGEFRTELAWLDALHKDGEIPVPAPIPNRDGELLTRAAADGVPQPRWCVLMHWIKGGDLYDRLSPSTYRRFGRLSAQLHRHALCFHPTDPDALRTYDGVFSLMDDVSLFSDANRGLLRNETEWTLREAVDRVQTELDALYASGEPPRVLHNDLHHWNVKVWGHRLTPFDFEDLAWGYPIQDVATTLFYVRNHSDYEALREAFRAGYETVLPWPARHADQLDTLIAGRALLLLNHLFSRPSLRDELGGEAFATRYAGYCREWLRLDEARYDETDPS